jgi:hypothetical protein
VNGWSTEKRWRRDDPADKAVMDVQLERRDGQGHQTETKDARPTSSGGDAPDTRRTRERSTPGTGGNCFIESRWLHLKKKRFVCAQWDGVSSLIFFNFSSEGAKGKWAFYVTCSVAAMSPWSCQWVDFIRRLFFNENKWKKQKVQARGVDRAVPRAWKVPMLSEGAIGSPSKDTHTPIKLELSINEKYPLTGLEQLEQISPPTRSH